VDILVILGCLIAALVYSVFSCARSYFEKGRLQGMEEATREFARGISSHYELEGQGTPERVAMALKGVKAAGMRRKAPAEGRIRIDFSLNELLQLGWLAHLGFQHMMPNYRDFEIHRFSGEVDAREGALAVAKVEAAIPAKARPLADLSVLLKRRQKLVSDWWQAGPARSKA
jgi:hypothetical protein